MAMTRARAVLEIRDLVRWRDEQRRKDSYSSDGYRSDTIQCDETTEALRVALEALRAGEAGMTRHSAGCACCYCRPEFP